MWAQSREKSIATKGSCISFYAFQRRKINEFQGVIDATKYFDDYTEVYTFNTADNTVIGAEYNYRQSDATNSVIKDAFLTMLDEEKANPEQPSLEQYNGGYEPMEDDEYITYKTKDEFISAMKSLNFKDVYKAWSRSTYAGGKKTVVRIEDGWLYYSAGNIKEMDW